MIVPDGLIGAPKWELMNGTEQEYSCDDYKSGKQQNKCNMQFSLKALMTNNSIIL